MIIDHDITKTALLDWDIPVEMAGRASYGVLHALARDLLIQGRASYSTAPVSMTISCKEACHLPTSSARNTAISNAWYRTSMSWIAGSRRENRCAVSVAVSRFRR